MKNSYAQRLLIFIVISSLVLFWFWSSSSSNSNIVSEESNENQQDDEKRIPLANEKMFTPETNEFQSLLLRCAKNCYDPRCYAPAKSDSQEKEKEEEDDEVGCVPNPFYYSSSSTSAVPRNAHHTEFQCASRKSERNLLSASASSSASSASPSSTLLDWKRKTSWMFEKYYDFDAKCENTANSQKDKESNNNNEHHIMKASHGKNSLYRLENFCLRPVGKVAGFFGPSPSYTYSSSETNKKHNNDIKRPKTVEEFGGTDEQYKLYNERSEEGFRRFMNEVEVLKEKPKCFLSDEKLKVVLFPVIKQIDNVGHMLHRTASMLRLIELEFGGEKMNNNHNNNGEESFSSSSSSSSASAETILIIYVVTFRGVDAVQNAKINREKNAARFFYDVLSSSSFPSSSSSGGRNFAWASVFGSDAAKYLDENAWKSFFPFLSSSSSSSSSSSGENIVQQQLSEPLVCFRRGVVWQNAHVQQAMRKDFGASPSPGAQTSFQMFGKRTFRDVETLQLLNEKVRSCSMESNKIKSSSTNSAINNKRRLSVNHTNPHIVFVVRSQNRLFSLQPHLIHSVGKFLSSLSKSSSSSSSSSFPFAPTFQVVELQDLSFSQILATFSRADILVGMLGAGLIFSEFMPPGGLVIEFTFPGYRCSGIAGINKNSQCDFGGGANVGRQYHIAMATDFEAIRRWPVEPHVKTEARVRRNMEKVGAPLSDLAIGEEFFLFGIKKALCIILASFPSSSSSSFSSSSLSKSFLLDISVHAGTGELQPPKLPSSRMNKKAKTKFDWCAGGDSDFDKSTLLHLSEKDVEDNHGENFAAHARMMLLHPKLRSSSSESDRDDYDYNEDESLQRLKLMIKYRKMLSKITKSLRFRTESAVTMHLLVSSSTTKSKLAAVKSLREILAWRGIIQQLYGVVLGEGAPAEQKHKNKMKNRKTKQKDETSEHDSSSPQDSIDELFSYYKKTHSFHGVTVCDFPCRVSRSFDLVIRSGNSSDFESAIRFHQQYADRHRGVVLTFDLIQERVSVYGAQWEKYHF